MAKKSHVPKFGERDEDDTPYTVYFENAQRENSGGRAEVKKMNPNDPAENPEVFKMLRRMGSLENDGADFSISWSPLHPNTAINKSEGKSYSNASWRNNSNSCSDQKKSSKRSYNKSSTSTTTTDWSSTDKSHHTDKSTNKNVGIHHRHSRRGHQHQESNVDHQRNGSIPKFGEWDESDPTSGDGFTVVFNKVKEEKRIGSSPFPAAHIPSSQPKTSCHTRTARSKVCCLPFFKGCS